jgi:DNA-binding response OmpR family regulator
LIVDDEEGILDYTHKILELKGYQTVTALDGPAAVENFKKERPQMAIIDVFLAYSPFDGVEVLEKIKQIDKEIECIMVTRITDEEKIKKSRELGAVHYLLKPIDTKDLLAVVNEVAEKIRRKEAACG